MLPIEAHLHGVGTATVGHQRIGAACGGSQQPGGRRITFPVTALPRGPRALVDSIPAPFRSPVLMNGALPWP